MHRGFPGNLGEPSVSKRGMAGRAGVPADNKSPGDGGAPSDAVEPQWWNTNKGGQLGIAVER